MKSTDLGRVYQFPVPDGLGDLAGLWFVLLGFILNCGFIIIVSLENSLKTVSLSVFLGS